MSLRLYFSPQRIKKWADALLAEQGAAAGLKFRSVRLVLARESMPEFALELEHVEASPAQSCRTEPSVVIEKLRLPLSFTALLQGRLELGKVSAEDVSVDVDGLKNHCPDLKAEAAAKVSSAAMAPAASGEGTRPVDVTHVQPAKLWWRPEQLKDLQKRIGELDFRQVEISFERKTKKVYLKTLAIIPDARSSSVHVIADLEIPPDLVYNEQLPSLHFDALAKSDNADVTLKAALSEGAFIAKAKLRPAPNDQLETDLSVQLQDVPLSTLAPLIAKAGIVRGDFKPRFLWMGCQASIHGNFQGLFLQNPLALENCQVVGNGSVIQLAKAVRRADGSWEPFKVDMKNVDVGRMLDTFNWRGLESVFNDYGSLNGSGEITSAHQAHFEGRLNDSQIRFSNRGVHAFQKLNQVALNYTLQGNRAVLTSDAIDIEGGEFKGKFEAIEDQQSHATALKADIQSLKLSPGVELLYLNGTAAAVSGEAVAGISDGKIHSFKGHLKLSQLDGRDFKMPELMAQSEYVPSDDEFVLNLHSPEFQIKTDSSFFRATRPLFFAHEFPAAWVDLHDMNLKSHFLKEGGIRWSSLATTLENGHVHFSSAGVLTRERVLAGWVGLDYPSVKKLRWAMTGTLDQPVLKDESKSLTDLRKNNPIDDKVLGLPHANTAE